MLYAIAYDVGTTGVKTCLFAIEKEVRLLAGEYGAYDLCILPDGGVEQDAEQWWEAMCQSTKRLFERVDVRPDQIGGISFCSQMQGLVLVDREGRALRRPMSYMDQRAGAEFRETQTHGVTISGVALPMLLKSLLITRAASTSVKDPLWKYKWVEKHEPEVFSETYKWLDVKEYLICRCTGEFVMTRDSAFSTFLYDTRKGREGWSHALCRMYGVDEKHLPALIECTDVAGTLTERAAAELGLAAGTPVYGGGGDATLIGVGAGATRTGDTHIYSGTSGWVGTVIEQQKVDLTAMIAGTVGAQKGKYHYFAEMETAGKCFEWVRAHMVEDEIDAYLHKINVADSTETAFESLYDYMSEAISKIPAGAGGVIFTPWLHGNRCPFEDPNAAGMFFNIKIETGEKQMIRAVLEGICFHLRWMLECQDKKIRTSPVIRFVGGGALSPVTCQILADVTGRIVETVQNTKDVGAIGAAMLIAVGKGIFSDLSEAAALIQPHRRYEPNEANRAVYEKNYRVFRRLYESNKKNFALLNGMGQ
ncbi:MAG: FGGY-family carbohydrate kinase [Oscillospiraceae bacterium]|nr:FGGY-family carbohydrate kinase [Oscillospiraceae bacterium]